MTIAIDTAYEVLDSRHLLRTNPNIQSELLVAYVSQLIGRQTPKDLAEFYRKRISGVADFIAIAPTWKERIGQWVDRSWALDFLLGACAIPIFDDGCGSLFGVDISADVDHPAVYFFDHEDRYEKANYAAGSSIGAFLLLLAEHDQAVDEKRPRAWQLKIDPDIDRCPRAPPIWLAD